MNSKRLLAMADLIDTSDIVLDIGCDHAYLALLLLKRNIRVVSSDISKAIVDIAKEQNPNLEFRHGNGLEVIKDSDNFNLVVVAGLGSKTIIDILNNIERYNIESIVVSSNNNSYEIRDFLTNHGFLIDREIIVNDKGKYYEIDKFKKGLRTYTPEDIYFGPLNLTSKDDTFKAYYEKKKDKLKNIILNMEDSARDKKNLVSKLEYLEKYTS